MFRRWHCTQRHLVGSDRPLMRAGGLYGLVQVQVGCLLWENKTSEHDQGVTAKEERAKYLLWTPHHGVGYAKTLLMQAFDANSLHEKQAGDAESPHAKLVADANCPLGRQDVR